jgi:glycosyltransferase involved in cell wall biosynthesis
MKGKQVSTPKIARTTTRLRVLVVGFAYIIGVYQSKLKAIQDTGSVDVAWLAPLKWNMRSWKRIIPLENKFKQIRVYPVNIQFLNGINGGYLYPLLSTWRAINNFKPDILHYEQEAFSLSAFQMALFARLLKIPFTIFCWENIEKPLAFYRRWTTRYVLDAANTIVVGNNEAEQILRNWGYNRKIVVMPQIGVDTNLFFRQHRPSPGRVFTIGYIGRLVPEKGVDLLFDAARYLIQKGIIFRIIVCGSGSSESELRSYAEALMISETISWLGPIKHEDIPEVLVQTDAVVLPSRTKPGIWKEQFGHILIEAMAMGIPVIGSNSGAIPEVIGRTDLIFSEDNSEELALILQKLLIDKEWAGEVSRFLEERAIKEYSDQKIADLMLSIWAEIVVAQK